MCSGMHSSLTSLSTVLAEVNGDMSLPMPTYPSVLLHPKFLLGRPCFSLWNTHKFWLCFSFQGVNALVFPLYTCKEDLAGKKQFGCGMLLYCSGCKRCAHITSVSIPLRFHSPVTVCKTFIRHVKFFYLCLPGFLTMSAFQVLSVLSAI